MRDFFHSAVSALEGSESERTGRDHPQHAASAERGRKALAKAAEVDQHHLEFLPEDLDQVADEERCDLPRLPGVGDAWQDGKPVLPLEVFTQFNLRDRRQLGVVGQVVDGL